MFDMLKRNNSKDVAKERLQVILVHDRIQLSPRDMEEMKKEIIAVVSKYVEIDEAQFEVSVERKNTSTALHADIPIRGKR